MSRDPSLLTPTMHRLYSIHYERCQKAGYDVFLTFTLRTRDEQAALFAQGRQALGTVNILRAAVRMLPITEKENSKPVTWTMESMHLPDAHGFSRAYDLGIKIGGIPVWNPKLDADHNKISDWEDIARIAEGIELDSGERLRAGIRFPRPDPPHYQLG